MRRTLLKLPPFVAAGRSEYILPAGMVQKRVIDWLGIHGVRVVSQYNQSSSEIRIQGELFLISAAIKIPHKVKSGIKQPQYWFRLIQGGRAVSTKASLARFKGAYVVFWDMPLRPFYYLDGVYMDRSMFRCEGIDDFPRPFTFVGNLGTSR